MLLDSLVQMPQTAVDINQCQAGLYWLVCMASLLKSSVAVWAVAYGVRQMCWSAYVINDVCRWWGKCWHMLRWEWF